MSTIFIKKCNRTRWKSTRT